MPSGGWLLTAARCQRFYGGMGVDCWLDMSAIQLTEMETLIAELRSDERLIEIMDGITSNGRHIDDSTFRESIRELENQPTRRKAAVFIPFGESELRAQRLGLV